MEHNPHSMAFSDPLDVEGVKKRSAMQTIGSILPFLWPANNREMQLRVVIAISCLLLGRIANVYGPIVLKDLIDGLEGLTTGSRALDGLWILAFIYGLTVLLPGALNELRSAVFTPVSEYAQRSSGCRHSNTSINLGCAFTWIDALAVFPAPSNGEHGHSNKPLVCLHLISRQPCLRSPW